MKHTIYKKGKTKSANNTRSVFENLRYCAACTAEQCPALLALCVPAVLVQSAETVISVCLPRAAALLLREGTGMSPFLPFAELLLAGALLSAVGAFLQKYIYHRKYVMNTYFFRKAAEKGLSTAWTHLQDETFLRLQKESFACADGNYSPFAMLYETVTALLAGFVGLAVFGGLLAALQPGMLFLLILTAVLGYLLDSRVTHWISEHDEERMRYSQKLSYVNRISGDTRYAKDFRMYDMGAWFSVLYRENMRLLLTWYRRLRRTVLRVSAGAGLLGLLGDGAAYGYLIFLLYKGRISVEDLVLYLGIVTGFSVLLAGILEKAAAVVRYSRKIDNFRAYLSYPEPEDGENKEKRPVPDSGKPCALELRDVGFRYPGSERFIFRHISLTIRPGEHLALVGLNGAGKTTLIRLLCGLDRPTEGTVRYGGVDIREIDTREYRRVFSAVFQEYSLLPVTVGENIASVPSDSPLYDRAKLEDCIRRAGLEEAVGILPQGADTPYTRMLAEDGTEFSGGEIQKLLFARALYRNGAVLLLDEPTAALDPVSESEFYGQWHTMSEGKTAVFISHRLAGTRFCDRILLLSDGRILEEGTHEELLSAGGEYARLFSMQAEYYRDRGTADGASASADGGGNGSALSFAEEVCGG